MYDSRVKVKSEQLDRKCPRCKGSGSVRVFHPMYLPMGKPVPCPDCQARFEKVMSERKDVREMVMREDFGYVRKLAKKLETRSFTRSRTISEKISALMNRVKSHKFKR
jgi:endogenous inhibitor of DNA gyrase (YacG/DUF329 family)